MQTAPRASFGSGRSLCAMPLATSLSLSNVMDELSQRVKVEGSPVSYSWLSQSVSVTADLSKRLLYEFLCRNEGSVSANYYVAGRPKGVDDPNGFEARVVSSSDLEAAKSAFDRVDSLHVYSVFKTVAKGSPAESTLDVLVAENMAQLRDLRLEAVGNMDCDNSLATNCCSAIKNASVVRRAITNPFSKTGGAAAPPPRRTTQAKKKKSKPSFFASSSSSKPKEVKPKQAKPKPAAETNQVAAKPKPKPRSSPPNKRKVSDGGRLQQMFRSAAKMPKKTKPRPTFDDSDSDKAVDNTPTPAPKRKAERPAEDEAASPSPSKKAKRSRRRKKKKRAVEISDDSDDASSGDESAPAELTLEELEMRHEMDALAQRHAARVAEMKARQEEAEEEENMFEEEPEAASMKRFLTVNPKTKKVKTVKDVTYIGEGDMKGYMVFEMQESEKEVEIKEPEKPPAGAAKPTPQIKSKGKKSGKKENKTPAATKKKTKSKSLLSFFKRK